MTVDPGAGAVPPAAGASAAPSAAPAASPGASVVAPTVAPARPRAPWSLRLAGLAWIVAGFVFALGPALVALLLQLQYASLKRQAFRLAGLADAVDPTELLEVEQYLAEFDRVEALVVEAAGWILVPLLVVYACIALLALAGYLVFGVWTVRGANWARITGTVLCGVSTPIVLLVWLLFASLSWIPLDALWANHAGLVLIGLHAAGVVLAWLPASNAYVRARRPR